MNRVLKFGGQAAVYVMIAAILAYFSNRPSYTHFPADRALIKLSFTHGGKRKAKCRRRTAQELAKLPHNKRKPYACPRARVPVYVEFEMDGRIRFKSRIRPGGLAGDGPARVYERFVVTPGRHVLVARLRDSDRKLGFDYEKRAEVVIAPRRNFVIDFHADKGGFIFK